jgi:hypothetical protein
MTLVGTAETTGVSLPVRDRRQSVASWPVSEDVQERLAHPSSFFGYRRESTMASYGYSAV